MNDLKSLEFCWSCSQTSDRNQIWLLKNVHCWRKNHLLLKH